MSENRGLMLYLHQKNKKSSSGPSRMCARVVNHISQYNKKAKVRTSGETVLIRINNQRLKREDKKNLSASLTRNGNSAKLISRITIRS
jgi:hypothetical protein